MALFWTAMLVLKFAFLILSFQVRYLIALW